MNILYIDDESLPKRWYDKQNSITNVTTYENAVECLKKQKFEVVDVNLDIKGSFDGCDIIRYIIKEQLEIPYIYIRSNNTERISNMIKLLKKFANSEIQYS